MSQEYPWYEFPQIIDTFRGRKHAGIIIEYHSIRELLEKISRIVILSSPLAFPNYITLSVKISLRTFKEIIDTAKRLEIPIVSYHGHQTTLDVINAIVDTNLSANKEPYTPQEGDIAIAIKLKKRLEKPEDIKSVEIEDVEIILLQYTRITDI